MDQQQDRANNFCPECGAPFIDGMSCWEQLGGIIAWEWQDPELRAQHFLTVASYNIQHPAQFVDEMQTKLRSAFIEYVDQVTPLSEIHRRMARVAEGKVRVLKKETERRPVLQRWPMTIADVYIPDKPEGAADRVKAWAASIREELQRQ